MFLLILTTVDDLKTWITEALKTIHHNIYACSSLARKKSVLMSAV